MLKLDMQSMETVVAIVGSPMERRRRVDAISCLKQLIAESERGTLTADVGTLRSWLSELQR
jgi:hypothetical protein